MTQLTGKKESMWAMYHHYDQYHLRRNSASGLVVKPLGITISSLDRDPRWFAWHMESPGLRGTRGVDAGGDPTSDLLSAEEELD